MTVHIGTKHLVKGTERKTYSDSNVKGFALRTTPKGTFTFYFQYLDRTTGKRDWHLIGEYPQWDIEKARNEARGLAKIVGDQGTLKHLRAEKAIALRVSGITFADALKAYIDYCKAPVERTYGKVPRMERWASTEIHLNRPLKHWGSIPLCDISRRHVMLLLHTWIDAGHPSMANQVRGLLHTMFKWCMTPPREWIIVNPCTNLPRKEIERSQVADGRALSADEIRTLWFGLDDPQCPGERLSKLALKLSLVTALRTGEIVAIERENVGSDTVTIPLHVVKSRRSNRARDVVQPLNSLAREILGEVFARDINRKYAFPGKRSNEHILQPTLTCLLVRKSTDYAGKMGICEYLRMKPFTAHALRRTAATIMSELAIDDAIISKVLTHKAVGKDAAPVTQRYIVARPIIARPVDPRIDALNKLDAVLREILELRVIGQRKTLPKRKAA